MTEEKNLGEKHRFNSDESSALAAASDCLLVQEKIVEIPERWPNFLRLDNLFSLKEQIKLLPPTLPLH